MSNQHPSGKENTSKMVFSEGMEITENAQCLETLSFCLFCAEVLDILHWMLHCVCNPWAKEKLSYN